MAVKILRGDCREVLRTLEPESVHCVVTSPPYWGLRDYGVDGQIGLEHDFAEYIESMVIVFREVKRVLRSDGTVWLNLGDSYTSTAQGTFNAPERIAGGNERTSAGNQARARFRPFTGLKSKDLCGIPWRVAFALQADGWWLRSDIIWSKPNPMPESVTDRPTKAHEYIFLLSKSERYYYDHTAILEPVQQASLDRAQYAPSSYAETIHNLKGRKAADGTQTNPEGRNKRTVWEVTTSPFHEAHFATFPPALIEPCIKAGCPAQCCAKCGAPWVREVERTAMIIDRSERTHSKGHTRASGTMIEPPRSITLGFSPSCSCIDAFPRTKPGTVLDPFGGAGTTGLVADRLGCNAILIELNPEYAAMAERRIRGDAPLFAEVS